MMMKGHGSSVALVLSALGLAACQLAGDGVDVGADDDPGAWAEAVQAVSVPARGTATTLDVGSWNIEFFGDPSNGPTNEALQLSNVRDVIAGTDFDLWGLEEVVSTTQFNSLVSQLPGYAGFLANAPSVVNGAAFYSDFSNQEQKVGLLFKTSIVSVLGAAVILTQNNTDFAGQNFCSTTTTNSIGVKSSFSSMTLNIGGDCSLLRRDSSRVSSLNCAMPPCGVPAWRATQKASLVH